MASKRLNDLLILPDITEDTILEIKYLVESGAKSDYYIANKIQSSDIINILLDYMWFNTREIINKDYNLLHHFIISKYTNIINNDLSIIRKLIDMGCDTIYNSRTPLYYVNTTSKAKALIDLGFDINFIYNGETAYDYQKNIEIKAFLKDTAYYMTTDEQL